MREERLEILRMVADQVISVEEAERLLAALAEGRSREDIRPVADLGRGFADVGRGFAGMGRSIGESVRRAVKTALKSGGLESGFEVPEGTEIVIEDLDAGGGDLLLVPATSSAGRLEWSGVCVVEEGEGAIRLRRSTGEQTVHVPDSAGRVSVTTHRGCLRALAVGVPLGIETLHGDLEIVRPGDSFRVETLSGAVSLDLDRVVGESKASTMYGDIVVAVGGDVSASLRATSLDGSVDVEEGLGRMRTAPGTMAPLTADLEIGPPPVAARLLVETASGTVRVRRRR